MQSYSEVEIPQQQSIDTLQEQIMEAGPSINQISLSDRLEPSSDHDAIIKLEDCDKKFVESMMSPGKGDSHVFYEESDKEGE